MLKAVQFHLQIVSAVAVLAFLYKLFQWYMGVKISSENLRLDLQVIVQLGIIIVVAIILWSPFFQIVDSLVKEEMSVLDQFALGGFKSGFILMPIQLGLLSLFSPLDYPFQRYIKIVIPGLLVGVVLIFVLVSMKDTVLTSGLGDTFSWFYGVYPFVLSFILRTALTKDMKSRRGVEREDFRL